MATIGEFYFTLCLLDRSQGSILPLPVSMEVGRKNRGFFFFFIQYPVELWGSELDNPNLLNMVGCLQIHI
jgi:hypothetical protein